MGDELGVHNFTLDVPDGTRGVNARSPDSLRLSLVPIERGQRAAEIAVLVPVKEALELDAVVGDPPNAEEVAGGGEEVGLGALLVGDEDGFCRRVRVLEREVRVGSDLAVGVVELDYLDPVGEMLEEARDG